MSSSKKKLPNSGKNESSMERNDPPSPAVTIENETSNLNPLEKIGSPEEKIYEAAKKAAAEEGPLSDSGMSSSEAAASATAAAVPPLSAAGSRSSFSDGYSTPSDALAAAPSTGGAGKRAAKYLPFSPFHEDDEYNDFIFTDEELGEFIEPDEDDDDDDDDYEDEEIQILPDDLPGIEPGADDDLDQFRISPLHQKLTDTDLEGYEAEGFDEADDDEDEDDDETRSPPHQHRTMEGGAVTPPPLLEPADLPTPPPLPPILHTESSAISTGGTDADAVPTNLLQSSSSSSALGVTMTPTRALGTPVLSFRRMRNDANELAAMLTGMSGGGVGGGVAVSGNRDRTKSAGEKATLFRYIRSWGSNSSSKQHPLQDEVSHSAVDPGDVTITRSTDEVLGDRDDSSDDLSGAAENENMSEDSWDTGVTMERAWEKPIEWKSFPVVPQRFCPVETSSTPKYLDPIMMKKTMLEKEGNRFVWEQSLLLKAVLQLLTERDQVGVEGSIDSRDNIWKKGPLKLLSEGSGRRKRPGTTNRWKVKYVELRQGNLTYYEDSGKGRKTIHLRQADTVIQPSVSHRHQQGFVFELLVKGSPARFWLASSLEEQREWIKAIQSAAIGDEGPKRELDLTPHRQSLGHYTAVREKVKTANTWEEYLDAIQFAMTVEDALQVPVEWIRSQTKEEHDEVANARNSRMLPHKQLKFSVADFWNKMGQSDFSVNGATIPRHTPFAAERVVGGLTRCLLEYDRAFTGPVETTAAGKMTELQAVSYARNILQAVLRSNDRQDASSAVHYLLNNDDIVVVSSPLEEDFVVNLEVSFAGEELPDDLPLIAEEQTGWIKMRRNKQPTKGQKARYAVLSGSVLSYYEEATPRPHGLRGQMVLTSASIQEQKHDDVDSDGYRVLLLKTLHSEDCYLVFDNDNEFQMWKSAIQHAIESCTSDRSSSMPSDERRARQAIMRSAERVLKQADGSIRGGIRVIKNATDGSKKLIRGAVGRVGRLRPIRGALSMPSYDQGDGRKAAMRRPSMQMLLSNTTLSGKREPTVQCVVQVTHIFDVGRRCESGADTEQLLSVSAKMYQAFLMMGGQSGRMARGDALIEFEFGERAANIDFEEEEADGVDEVGNYSDGQANIDKGLSLIDEE